MSDIRTVAELDTIESQLTEQIVELEQNPTSQDDIVKLRELNKQVEDVKFEARIAEKLEHAGRKKAIIEDYNKALAGNSEIRSKVKDLAKKLLPSLKRCEEIIPEIEELVKKHNSFREEIKSLKHQYAAIDHPREPGDIGDDTTNRAMKLSRAELQSLGWIDSPFTIGVTEWKAAKVEGLLERIDMIDAKQGKATKDGNYEKMSAK